MKTPTLKNTDGLLTHGENHCIDYLLHLPGRGTYDAEFGLLPTVSTEDAGNHNLIFDRMIVAGLDACPVGKGGTFYLTDGKIQTFLGTLIDGSPTVSPLPAGVCRMNYKGMKFNGRKRKNGDDIFFIRIK